MRIFLIIGFVLIGNLTSVSKASNFTIDIFDYDNSMAYAMKYHLTADSISVIELSGLKGEHYICLLQKRLALPISNRLLNLIKSPDFKSLQNEYKNFLMIDGDQKRVVIELNGQKKTIEIENIYNKEIAQLIYQVNGVLTKDLK